MLVNHTKRMLFYTMIVLLLSCSNSPEKTEIYEKYNSGKPKIIHVFKTKKKVFGNPSKIIELDEEGRKSRIKFPQTDREIQYTYFPNGQKKSQLVYCGDFRDGQWIWWHENGIRKEVNRYVNGRLHGSQIEWDDQGEIIGRGSFQDGTGDFSGWYPGGEKRREIQLTECEGLETEWYKNGQKKLELEISQCKAWGSLQEWYESGEQKVQAHFVDGEFHGFWREWYESGQIMREISYEHGEPHGSWKPWNREGMLIKEGHFKHGDGKWKTWNDDGQLLKEGNFIDNKFTGYEFGWYPNRQMKFKASYHDDEFHGKYEEWFKDGLKKVHAIFDDGKLMQQNKWYRNGKLWSHFEIKSGHALFTYYSWSDTCVYKTPKEIIYSNEDLRLLHPFFKYMVKDEGQTPSEKFHLIDLKFVWIRNGTKFFQGNYKDKKRDGTFLLWNSKDNILEKRIYRKGDLKTVLPK